MSLTGQSLPVLLALLAFIFFVALVLGWPHFGRKFVDGSVRGLFAVLMNLMVVLLAGAVLNDQYAFYVSWDDLMGVTGPTVQAHGGGTAADVVKAKVKGAGFTQMQVPTNLPPLPNPHSRLQKYTVTGQQSGVRGEVLVELPAGYDPKKAATYPVIEALHGFPGHPEAYLHLNNFFGTVDKAVAEHRMAAPIIVIPAVNTPSGLDTECVNAPGGLQTETWLARDIPAWTVQHFRAERKRTAWASFGFSFGGWCSAVLGIKHSDVFGASIIMQGYFRPDFDPSYVPFKPGSPEYAQYDLVEIAKRHAPAVALWILASKQDSLSYPSTNSLVKDAHRPLYVTADLLKEGGHRAAVWVPKIPTTLQWLGQTLPGFAPSKN